MTDPRTRAVDWLLCDYGQVLSTAPPPGEWDALRHQAGGLPEPEFHAVYWEHRPAYDRGDLDVADYWKLVLGRPVHADRLQELIGIDTAMWLHPDRASVEAAVRAGTRGLRLAIFSNAPVEVAAGIDRLDWLAPFERRFYSCHLRAVKPEPEAYEQVLAGLGAEPRRVAFFDDRASNVAAAEQAGIRAFVYRDPGQFDAIG